jgi:hypothetical protein
MSKATRRFVGYTQQQMERLEATLAGRVVNRASPCSTFVDVLVMPAKKYAHGRFAGGAYSRGRYLEQLRLRRGDVFHMTPSDGALPTPAQRIGAAWYAGILFDHYGHFILESISRLTDARVIESDDPIVFLDVLKVGTLRPYMEGVLNWLGINPCRAVLVSEPLGVDRLTTIEPNFVSRDSINLQIRRVIQKPHKRLPRGLVYLSRSKLMRHRVVENEEAVEAMVTRLGGAVIHPQTLPFREQVELLDRAHTVIGVEGSALHTLMFASAPRRAITLSAGVPSLSFLLLDELSDRESVYMNALSDGDSMDRKKWCVTPALVGRLEKILTGSVERSAIEDIYGTD